MSSSEDVGERAMDDPEIAALVAELAFEPMGDAPWYDADGHILRDNPPYTDEAKAAYVNALESELRALREQLAVAEKYKALATERKPTKVILVNGHVYHDEGQYVSWTHAPMENCRTCDWLARYDDLGTERNAV